MSEKVIVTERCPECFTAFEREVTEDHPAVKTMATGNPGTSTRLCPDCRDDDDEATGYVTKTSVGDLILESVFGLCIAAVMIAVTVWFVRWLLEI